MIKPSIAFAVCNIVIDQSVVEMFPSFVKIVVFQKAYKSAFLKFAVSLIL